MILLLYGAQPLGLYCMVVWMHLSQNFLELDYVWWGRLDARIAKDGVHATKPIKIQVLVAHSERLPVAYVS